MYSDKLVLKGRYDVVCLDSEGNVKWTDVAHNQTTNQGKNGMLNGYLGAGAVPASWYCSLITASSISLTSVYSAINSTSPATCVTEVGTGVIAARKLMTWAAAGTPTAGAIASNTVSFAITGAATVIGNMVVSGGTGITNLGDVAAASGVLLSAGSFTGGPKTVGNGDTLNVSYSLSM